MKRWVPNDLLREARLRLSLSQGQLAALIGVRSHNVGRWERGEALPSIDARKSSVQSFR